MISIRCKRGGAKKNPCYRIVAAEKTMKRDGRFIEEIGTYFPVRQANSPEENFQIKQDRLQYYLNNGAQMSATVKNLLKRTVKEEK